MIAAGKGRFPFKLQHKEDEERRESLSDEEGGKDKASIFNK